MTAENEVYLKVEQVAARFGVSTDTIYRWKRERDFPKSRKLTSGSVRWRLSDIVEWESTVETGFATHFPWPTSPGTPSAT